MTSKKKQKQSPQLSKSTEIARQAAAEMSANLAPGQQGSPNKAALTHLPPGEMPSVVVDPYIVQLGKIAENR